MWTSLERSKDDVPNFTTQNMMNYFVERLARDNEKNKDYGHGHVQKIKVSRDVDSNLVCFHCHCLPEMKKNVRYNLSLSLVASGLKEREITYASCCSCPAGKGPYASCKYTAALCFALEEFVRLQSSRDFQTCTERLQTLNQPRKKKLDPQTVYKIDFSRKVYGRKEESVTKQLNNPRPQAYRENNSHKANESLLNELLKGKSNCGFFFLFSTEKLQPSNNSASNREQNSVLQSVNVT